MDPLWRSRMLCLTTSRLQSMAAVTSTAMVAFQFSRVWSQMCRSLPGCAALLHMTSTRPYSATVSATMAMTAPSSVTSVVRAIALPPLARTAAATCSRSSVRRPANVRWAPSPANRWAMTSPNPSPAPVMMTTLSANLSMCPLRRRPMASRRTISQCR